MADYIPKAQAARAEINRIQQTQWPADEEGMINEYEGIIRFHVIANSDSDEDQELKFKVRNRVLGKVQNALEGSQGAAQTRAYIEKNLEEIEACARQCVRAEGYDYNVKARIGVTAIPAKQYDDVYFPAGSYEALTITIGEGKGQNWWCVVFPPLCLVDARESGHDELFAEDAQGRLVLKSKVVELLKKGGIKKQAKIGEQN
ncbi:MAG: stage II sporulation protein R [Anaerovoracaceae bacterium]